MAGPHRPSVLVVEDDGLIRWMVADFLTGAGFDVVEAASADEARARLMNGHAVSVVFSDVNMPGEMDGIGLARWIKTTCPALKVVLTSGRPQPDAAGLSDGGPLIPKPYELDLLAARLFALCGIFRA